MRGIFYEKALTSTWQISGGSLIRHVSLLQCAWSVSGALLSTLDRDTNLSGILFSRVLSREKNQQFCSLDLPNILDVCKL